MINSFDPNARCRPLVSGSQTPRPVDSELCYAATLSSPNLLSFPSSCSTTTSHHHKLLNPSVSALRHDSYNAISAPADGWNSQSSPAARCPSSHISSTHTSQSSLGQSRRLPAIFGHASLLCIVTLLFILRPQLTSPMLSFTPLATRYLSDTSISFTGSPTSSASKRLRPSSPTADGDVTQSHVGIGEPEPDPNFRADWGDENSPPTARNHSPIKPPAPDHDTPTLFRSGYYSSSKTAFQNGTLVGQKLVCGLAYRGRDIQSKSQSSPMYYTKYTPCQLPCQILHQCLSQYCVQTMPQSYAIGIIPVPAQHSLFTHYPYTCALPCHMSHLSFLHVSNLPTPCTLTHSHAAYQVVLTACSKWPIHISLDLPAFLMPLFKSSKTNMSRAGLLTGPISVFPRSSIFNYGKMQSRLLIFRRRQPQSFNLLSMLKACPSYSRTRVLSWSLKQTVPIRWLSSRAWIFRAWTVQMLSSPCFHAAHTSRSRLLMQVLHTHLLCLPTCPTIVHVCHLHHLLFIPINQQSHSPMLRPCNRCFTAMLPLSKSLLLAGASGDTDLADTLFTLEKAFQFDIRNVYKSCALDPHNFIIDDISQASVQLLLMSPDAATILAKGCFPLDLAQPGRYEFPSDTPHCPGNHSFFFTVQVCSLSYNGGHCADHLSFRTITVLYLLISNLATCCPIHVALGMYLIEFLPPCLPVSFVCFVNPLLRLQELSKWPVDQSFMVVLDTRPLLVQQRGLTTDLKNFAAFKAAAAHAAESSDDPFKLTLEELLYLRDGIIHDFTIMQRQYPQTPPVQLAEGNIKIVFSQIKGSTYVKVCSSNPLLGIDTHCLFNSHYHLIIQSVSYFVHTHKFHALLPLPWHSSTGAFCRPCQPTCHLRTQQTVYHYANRHGLAACLGARLYSRLSSLSCRGACTSSRCSWTSPFPYASASSTSRPIFCRSGSWPFYQHHPWAYARHPGYDSQTATSPAWAPPQFHHTQRGLPQSQDQIPRGLTTCLTASLRYDSDTTPGRSLLRIACHIMSVALLPWNIRLLAFNLGQSCHLCDPYVAFDLLPSQVHVPFYKWMPNDHVTYDTCRRILHATSTCIHFSADPMATNIITSNTICLSSSAMPLPHMQLHTPLADCDTLIICISPTLHLPTSYNNAHYAT